MKPEFKIKEVTRYIITRHDASGTQAMVQVDNRQNAEELLAAMREQADRMEEHGEMSVRELPIPNQAKVCLLAESILTVNQLKAYSFNEIRGLANMSMSMATQIEDSVSVHGGLRKE
jgi:hypothetical protein